MNDLDLMDDLLQNQLKEALELFDQGKLELKEFNMVQNVVVILQKQVQDQRQKTQKQKEKTLKYKISRLFKR